MRASNEWAGCADSFAAHDECTHFPSAHAIGIAGRYLTKAKIGETVVKVNTDGRPPAALGGAVHLSVPRDRLMLFADGNRVS